MMTTFRNRRTVFRKPGRSRTWAAWQSWSSGRRMRFRALGKVTRRCRDGFFYSYFFFFFSRTKDRAMRVASTFSLLVLCDPPKAVGVDRLLPSGSSSHFPEEYLNTRVCLVCRLEYWKDNDSYRQSIGRLNTFRKSRGSIGLIISIISIDCHKTIDPPTLVCLNFTKSRQ
jgi:hypothetical protein